MIRLCVVLVAGDCTLLCCAVLWNLPAGLWRCANKAAGVRCREADAVSD